jgi:hypothetical protein
VLPLTTLLALLLALGLSQTFILMFVG